MGMFPLGTMPIIGITDEDVDVWFYGLYGPRTTYPHFGDLERPNTVWFWVFGARARARTREGAHK